MKLTKQQRIELRMKFGGRCAYCGCPLPETGWHADHIEAVMRQSKLGKDKRGVTVFIKTGTLDYPANDCLANLVPACAPCNLDKGVQNLESWRGWLRDRLVDSMRRNIPNFRHAERFGLIVSTPGPLVFWFEVVLRSTATKQ